MSGTVEHFLSKLDRPSAASSSCLDAELTHYPTVLSHGLRLCVVGCMPIGHNMNVPDQDYAEKMIERLLTPRRHVLDAGLVDDLWTKIRSIVVDGAVIKLPRCRILY